MKEGQRGVVLLDSDVAGECVEAQPSRLLLDRLRTGEITATHLRDQEDLSVMLAGTVDYPELDIRACSNKEGLVLLANTRDPTPATA